MVRTLQRLSSVLLLCAQVMLCVCAVGLAETAHCECHHGAEASCDCPHHGGGGAADPNLPACHRRMAAKKAAEERKYPGMKSHCASSRAQLLVPMLIELPRSPEPAPEPTIAERIAGPVLRRVDHPRAPADEPPKRTAAV